MKIVCEACQAKYSIADEKVRGKVFKIRCKKCSHVIVVRGTGEMAAASGELGSIAEEAAVSAPADAAWHIVVDGEQVGPLPDSDIKARLARGEITGDTFIWKEGLADWAKISTLPEFASSVAPAAASFGGATQTTSNPFDAEPTVGVPAEQGHGMFSGAGASSDLFASPTTVSPGGGGNMADLFASPAAPPPEAAPTAVAASSPFAGFDQAPAAEAFVSPRVGGNGNGHAAAAAGGGGGLTGQRHENSVLFSLSNLEALAKPAAAPTPSAPRPGAGGGPTEGSGLIDIRAMANMTLGSSSSAAAAPSLSNANDLPAFSAPQFSPVAPVLLPMAQSSGMPKWVLGVLGVLGVLIVGLGVVLIKVFTAPPPVAPVAVAPAPVAAPVAAAPVAAAQPAAPPTTPQPAADEPLPPRETKPEAVAEKSDRGSSRGSKSSSSSRKSSGKSEPSEKPAAAAAPTPAPKAEKAEPAKPKDDIEALLAAATGGKKSSARSEDDAPKKEAPPANLGPLERSDIVKALGPVSNVKAKECFGQFKVPGNCTIKITVDQRGKVTNASATGKFAGTPSGNCLEAAVKAAKFPPSQGMTFDYPITLRP